MSTYSPEDEILARGEADWVHFAEVYGIVRKWAQVNSVDPRTETMRVLKRLLDSELISPGDVDRTRGFVPWNTSKDESLEEIIQRWDRLNHEPLPGDVSWFRNTETGDTHAREVLAHHDSTKKWISDPPSR